MTTTLVAGASGATGRLLVQHLLNQGHHVKAIVRSPVHLPESIRHHANLTLIHAPILELDARQLAHHVKDCSAVASCLGHNMTFKGLFGRPRDLVTQATRQLCQAIQANQPSSPMRFVLMNTTGNRNRDLDERVSFKHACVVGLLRYLLPPHADNENAADYLRVQIGHNDGAIQWSAVRPDGLVDEPNVTPYTLHPSPTRCAIFNAGKVSRINVAHFMATLMTEDEPWRQWQGHMPAIYGNEN